MPKEINNRPKWVGVNAPRYTSYPTAPNFTSDVNSQIYYKWLGNIADNSSVSLYIHIPFCKKLCWFCGCNTNIVNHYQPIANYLEYLLKEIDLLAKKVNPKSKISHIHFGGGSPTILEIADFSKIMDLIQQKFQIDKNRQISIEIDPRNVNSKKIAFYSKIGVNRVSIGVQDFNLKTQKAINRIQPFDMTKNLFAELRQYNINNINIDLIYGLPFQNISTIKETIKLAITLKPSRIALFSYAHLPSFKKHHNLIDEATMAGNEERLEMFLTASKILEENNYQAIGIDHFAIKNDDLTISLNNKTIKRNFQGYTTDEATSLIGIGLSSIGQLQEGYIQNSAKFREYKTILDQDHLPIVKGKEIDQEDRIRKEIIDNLMCFMEVDLNEIIKKYQLTDDYFYQEVKKLADEYEDIIQIKNQYIKITSKYKMSARAIAAIFDQYLQDNKYSKII